MMKTLLLILALLIALNADTLVIDSINKSDIKESFIAELVQKNGAEVVTLDEAGGKDVCQYKNVILVGSKAVKSVSGFGCMDTRFLYAYVLFPTLLNISEKSLLRGVAPIPSLKKLLRSGIKGKKNILFYSRYSEYMARHIEQRLKEEGIDIELVKVEKRHQVPSRLIEAAKAKRNLILLPDPLIATAENIKIIQSLTKKTDIRVISFFNIPNFDAHFIDLDNREYGRRVLELFKQDLTQSMYFIE